MASASIDRTLSATPSAQSRLVALAVPVALLGGALLSQYVGGLHPCEMCYWQRWPHGAAIALAAAAFMFRNGSVGAKSLTALAGIAIAVSGAIGVFHAGVEYGWWEGLTTCTASGGMSFDDLINTPLIRCDEVQWSLFGISLAGFNAIFSIGGAALVFALLLRRQP